MTWLTMYMRQRGLTAAGKSRLRRRLNRFVRAWERLAAQGACDELGGAECKRVLSQWLKDGARHALDPYIRLNANLPSPGSDAPPSAESEVL